MNNIEVLHTPEALYKSTAARIIELHNSSMERNGRFTIALSGGNTPRQLYELLAKPPFVTLVDWKNVFVFWSDERCVPFSDEANNSHMASVALLDNVPIPKENIFPVPVSFEPAKAAARYQQMITDFFREKVPQFDLVLLGLGEDGHTASLFPGNSILDERDALVKQVYIRSTNSYRVSFTVTLINHARHILFLVSGAEKSSILARLFNKPVKKNQYPAQLVKPVKGKLYWYLDKAAASRLIL